jgi:hypothetical protein
VVLLGALWSGSAASGIYYVDNTTPGLCDGYLGLTSDFTQRVCLDVSLYETHQQCLSGYFSVDCVNVPTSVQFIEDYSSTGNPTTCPLGYSLLGWNTFHKGVCAKTCSESDVIQIAKGSNCPTGYTKIAFIAPSSESCAKLLN